MDLHGNGVITRKELETVALDAGRTPSVAVSVFEWFAVEGNMHISLSRFVEGLVEQVIDGKSLRNAFESLDDDGSGQVTAKELYEALKALDPALTLEEVTAYVANAEINMDGNSSVQDHELDYGEFCGLFPSSFSRAKRLHERFAASQEELKGLSMSFGTFEREAENWIHRMEALVDSFERMCSKCMLEEYQDKMPVMIPKHFAKIEAGLKCPPGPANEKEFIRSVKKWDRKKIEDDSANDVCSISLGFDSFLQDLAHVETWSSLIIGDTKLLDNALNDGQKGRLNAIKAHAAARSAQKKLQLLIKRAKNQLQEYCSVIEALGTGEALASPISMSSRGLRPRFDTR